MRKDLCHLTVQKPPEFLFVAVDMSKSDDAFKHGLKRLKKPFIEMYEKEHNARLAFRKGHPSMFIVLAEVMAEDGFTFYHAETGEWLTDEIPSKYLRLC